MTIPRGGSIRPGHFPKDFPLLLADWLPIIAVCPRAVRGWPSGVEGRKKNRTQWGHYLSTVILMILTNCFANCKYLTFIKRTGTVVSQSVSGFCVHFPSEKAAFSSSLVRLKWRRRWQPLRVNRKSVWAWEAKPANANNLWRKSCDPEKIVGVGPFLLYFSLKSESRKFWETIFKKPKVWLNYDQIKVPTGALFIPNHLKVSQP